MDKKIIEDNSVGLAGIIVLWSFVGVMVGLAMLLAQIVLNLTREKE